LEEKQIMPTENSPLLTEANAQEIQLELIRRGGFNEFIGKEVYADLISNRQLWAGVLMDSTFPLAKLRDMVEDDYWFTDILYILAADEDCAKEFLKFAEKWNASSAEICSAKEMNELMGTLGRTERRLVEVWWD
jgi:hypothetical protein